MTVARRTARDPIAAIVLGLPEGQASDLRHLKGHWTTIRFANGRIREPFLERSDHLSLRVSVDRCLGTATGTDPTPAELLRLRAAATGLARVAPREPKFAGFPDGGRRAIRAAAFSEATARISPEAATRIAERILAAAEAAAPGGRIAGVVNVGTEEVRVVNSAGLDRTAHSSVAQASVLVDRPDRDPPVSGWSEGAHWNVAQLDPDRLGREAGDRVAKEPPEAVPPGNYRVVLRGPALADAFRFLAYLGFSGHGEDEGWSCLKRQRGKPVAPAFVTLVDDARSSATIPQPIDYEGLPARPIALIDRGRAGPAVTDVITASRLGRTTTGHASLPEAPWGEQGPEPTHLLLSAGDAREEELVRETRRGLLVTRFHYVRVVDPGHGIITGMTRDGTYRIDRGEIVGPVRNLRFTESLLTMLRGIELLGRERRIYADERGGSCVTTPSASVRSFRFTSATLF